METPQDSETERDTHLGADVQKDNKNLPTRTKGKTKVPPKLLEKIIGFWKK